MKKSIIALLLGMIFVFSGCDFQVPIDGALTSSTGSSVESLLNSNSESDIENENNNQTGDCINEHVDNDNDEKCDECGISVVAMFDFFAVNDLHGKFERNDSNIGVGTPFPREVAE